MNSTEVAIEKIKGDLNSINQKVDMNQQVILDVLEDIKKKLEKIEAMSEKFVTQESIASLQDRLEKLEHRTANTPLVNKVVFGAISLILVAVTTALIALVVRGQNS